MADAAHHRLPDAADLHRVLAGHWRECLLGLGIDETHLRRKKDGPCPMCGGTDRYAWTDHHDRGAYHCRNCGAGDGFKLLMGVHGWTFIEALQAVRGYLGYDTAAPAERTPPRHEPRAPERATATARVRDLLRTTTSPELVPDVVDYLRSRRLWPLPAGCSLKAHVGYDYSRRDGKSYEILGRFPMLVGRVQDIDGETISAHVTYIEHGHKLNRGDDVPARKLLSPTVGRQGCAIRLMPLAGSVLGVAEGIETALAASLLNDGLPVWSCIATSLLQSFVPPPGVHCVIVFADADVPGLRAAIALKEELEGRCDVEIRHPKLHDFAADWEAAK